MTHLTEEQITLAYYGELDPELRRHLDQCPDCRANMERLRDLLDALRDYPVPERDSSYGQNVWARLLPQLPAPPPRRPHLRWWMAAPALATLLVGAFFAGMVAQHRREPPAISPVARQRVLLMVMGDHLDRSQILLAELVNATPGDVTLIDERDRARDLVTQNRLLRQTSARRGNASEAALLDELERVLLDIANGPSKISPAGLESLQHRIESEGLLFKVRIVSSNIREKGQQL